REMRGMRAVRGGLPGGRDLSRSGRKQRHGAGGTALCVGLSDSQDALHLLRILRGSVPGRRNLHGQRLRARGVQQERFRLGQRGIAGSGCHVHGGNDDDLGQPLLPMQIGALGDIRGEFETVHDIMKRHSDVPLWLSVGDVASNDGEYFTPIAPLYWIKGNNEDFDVVAAAAKGRMPARTLVYLPNGGPHQVGPWRVAAL